MKSSEFHDYFEGKLSNRERNTFERKMQKDLFNADAAEGYAMISREEAEEDLNNAGKKIRRRINLRRRVGWYSAAATLAAILTITTIFLTVDQTPNDQDERIRKMSKELDNTAFEEKKDEATDTQQESQESEIDIDIESTNEAARVTTGENKIVTDDAEIEAATLEEEKEETFVVEEKVEAPAEAVIDNIGEGAPATEPAMVIIENDMEDDKAIEITEDQSEVYEFDMDMADEAESDAVIPEFANAEESMKKQEVTTREAVQLAPVSAVKTGSSAKSKAAVPEELEQVSGAGVVMDTPKTAAIQQATPVNGMTAYMEYLDSTLVFPEAEISRSNAIVDLKFYVLPNGKPYNIQIFSSPSQSFSDEAHRVITNGPAWTPASSDGEYVDSELEMRIEFKEEHKR